MCAILSEKSYIQIRSLHQIKATKNQGEARITASWTSDHLLCVVGRGEGRSSEVDLRVQGDLVMRCMYTETRRVSEDT